MKNTSRIRAFSLVELSIVILIIGILIVGVTQASRLVKVSRLQTARTLTQSSPVSGIKGVSLWLDSTSEAGIIDADTNDGVAVTVWNDINPQSVKSVFPNSTTISPLSITSDILYKESGINGLPVINFVGTTGVHFIGSAIPTTGNKFSYFVVYKSTDTVTTAVRTLFSNGVAGTNGWGYQRTTGTGSNETFLIGTSTLDGGASTKNPEIASVVYDGTTLETWINGAGKVSAAKTAVSPAGSLYIGGSSIANTSWIGYIGEIIIMDINIKDVDRYEVEKYLGKKWGIPVTAQTP